MGRQEGHIPNLDPQAFWNDGEDASDEALQPGACTPLSASAITNIQLESKRRRPVVSALFPCFCKIITLYSLPKPHGKQRSAHQKLCFYLTY